jgi:hypothetical protein
VVQELLTLPEHLSSPPVLSAVRVTRSLVLYICFVDRPLNFFFSPLCALVLSSGYPFGIVKLYLRKQLSVVSRIADFLLWCLCWVLLPCIFRHCVVCSSSIYGFWLPLWYIQTLLAFNSFDWESTWSMLFRKCIVRAQLDIYVFIIVYISFIYKHDFKMNITEIVITGQ